MARYARYLRLEKYIAAHESGSVRQRWEYGRRLLMDGESTTANGNLKHGVIDRLIANAAAAGFKLSAREIQWRLKAARTYLTEAQIRNVITDFETWFALTQAGFPQVEAPDDGEPYDPGTPTRRGATQRQGPQAGPVRSRAPAGSFDEIYSDYWPRDTYGPLSSLEDLAKHHEDMCAITERFARRDEERGRSGFRVIDAADGDMSHHVGGRRTRPAWPHRRRRVNEQRLQAAVIDMCKLCSIAVYHTFNSRRSVPGWPDLAMYGARRFILRELKASTAKPRPSRSAGAACCATPGSVGTCGAPMICGPAASSASY
jgi:hypothetical protein